MKINNKLLYTLYMEEVNRICDEIEWKTHFGPQEIVDLIAKIIEKNPSIVENDNGS